MLIQCTPEAREIKNALDTFVIYEFVVKTVDDGKEYMNGFNALIYLERDGAGINMKFIPMDFFDNYKRFAFLPTELEMRFVDFFDSKCIISNPLYDNIADIIQNKIGSAKKYFAENNIGVKEIFASPIDYDTDFTNIETLEDLLYAFQADSHVSDNSVMSLHSPFEQATIDVLSTLLAFFNGSESDVKGGIRGVGTLARIFNIVEDTNGLAFFCPSTEQIRNFRSSQMHVIKAIRDNLINGEIDLCALTFSPFFILLESANKVGLEVASFVGASSDTLYFKSSELVHYISIETDQYVDLAVEPDCLSTYEAISTLEALPFSTEVKISVNTRGEKLDMHDPRIICYGMLSSHYIEVEHEQFLVEGSVESEPMSVCH